MTWCYLDANDFAIVEDDSYQPKDRGIQLHMRHLKESMSADGTATTSGDGEAPVTPQKRKMPVGTNIGSTGKRARKEVAPKEHDSESDEAADATPITPRTPSSRRSKAKVKSYRITASLSSDDSDNDDTNEDGPIANKPAFGKATTRSREPHGAPSREAKNIKPAHSIKLDAEDESDSLAEQTETGMGMEDDSDASEYRPT